MTEGEIQSLNIIFKDFFAFIDDLVKDYGEPVSPTNDEFEQLKKKIVELPSNQNNHLPKQFFLVERVAGEILFSHNLNTFLYLKDGFDLMQFHSYIDDGTGSWSYLKEYFTWRKATYLFFSSIGKRYDIQKFAFKVKLPMRFIDGKIYWIIQESRPLELDSQNNIISYINTYSIIEIYKENEQIDLTFEIHYDNLYHDEWSNMLAENKYAIRPFAISSIQCDILKYYQTNTAANSVNCANELKYPRYTIKKYISDSKNKNGIINMARASFPHITFNDLKDVVRFLEKIAWFRVNN
ncbi:MAG: hypothetical protein JW717_04915 [Marinilabiliaceae bacterium]|nr:hypothetical protein [Marinilabiliaceae bacterium]